LAMMLISTISFSIICVQDYIVVTQNCLIWLGNKIKKNASFSLHFPQQSDFFIKLI
jgi:hypothetical protein